MLCELGRRFKLAVIGGISFMTRRPPKPSRLRVSGALFLSLIKRALVALAISYPLALLAVLGLLAWVGENHWLTTLALYVPRLPLLAPLPLLSVALLIVRRKALLWTQALALVILLFPLMGFVLPWRPARADAFTFRVFSLNASNGQFGYELIGREILRIRPDVAFLQEAVHAPELIETLEAHYPYVDHDDQFIVASRFPIEERTDPERLSYRGRQRGARYRRYRLTTPLGPMAFYSVHPASPRGVLNMHRFRGIFGRLRRGELFEGDPAEDVGYNTGHRALQVEAFAKGARAESLPVVIVGDTNLPGLSKTFRRNLSEFQDGFVAAGSGFGYTFPAKYPWMRIDRVLVSQGLRVVSFGVDCKGASDHLCVTAEIQRR